MTRRTWLVIPVLALACGTSEEEPAFAPPAAIASAGELQGVEVIAAGSAPKEISNMGLVAGHVARYSGSRDAVVRFYRMKAEASAFELVQKWRPEPGKMAIYSGSWFVVVEAPGADNETLSAIAEEVEVELVE